eukprot:CAMPEP_0197632026 /NCGR_PEP_ID=MMETSP1338-20131121/8972_1 /TAXON_ID=43686 ORGANISM="Pelagodinium beii, Strain RCC1491" /NCGR_SAMPLE_ID=MMETSP1338 /ASSEMBLY_ACC=CAM_ASM_000754 /LENGTH=112 /DNA_ID=CAMNT_0043203575 /DNA_START=578 /DNA_END=918 /DNA_ORIENTATION=-
MKEGHAELGTDSGAKRDSKAARSMPMEGLTQMMHRASYRPPSTPSLGPGSLTALPRASAPQRKVQISVYITDAEEHMDQCCLWKLQQVQINPLFELVISKSIRHCEAMPPAW